MVMTLRGMTGPSPNTVQRPQAMIVKITAVAYFVVVGTFEYDSLKN